MGKAPRWFGVIDKDGTVVPDAPGAWKAYRRTLANQRVEWTLTKYRKKASRNQHGFWRACYIPLIAESLGYLPHEYDAVHDAVMRKLCGMKEDSHPRLQIRKSSGDFNTVEFNEWLIEQTQVWAATELGIVLPDPDKKWKSKRKPRSASADAEG